MNERTDAEEAENEKRVAVRKLHFMQYQRDQLTFEKQKVFMPVLTK